MTVATMPRLIIEAGDESWKAWKKENPWVREVLAKWMLTLPIPKYGHDRPRVKTVMLGEGFVDVEYYKLPYEWFYGVWLSFQVRIPLPAIPDFWQYLPPPEETP